MGKRTKQTFLLRRYTHGQKVYETYSTSLVISQSVSQFSRSVVSDSLRPHKSQHTRPPCPSPTPGVHSDSRPLSHQRNVNQNHNEIPPHNHQDDYYQKPENTKCW